ncbi:MAG: tetratricopeptide repeat-containing sensor histidine kinase [Candidatus Delongbacteria bacterium]|nr:tetratricopeptide repeat-containing sensor histidine kinase [Candidatus Delongbacteria bacterium]MBN2835971.1 tetratricopeptide repeat-containing sensor histidine kinase [Candidatus Delongbacteria bacterium]
MTLENNDILLELKEDSYSKNKKIIINYLENVSNKTHKNYYSILLHIESLSSKLCDDRTYLIILNKLGEYYFENGDIQNSVTYCEKQIKLCESLEIYEYYGDSLNILGRILTDQNKIESALINLYKAYNFYESKENDTQKFALTMNLIGRVYWHQKKLNEAKKCFVKSLELRRKADDLTSIASSLSNLGLLCKDENDYQSSENYLAEALEIVEKTSDIRIKGAIFTNFGALSLKTENFKTARKYYLKALKLYLIIGDPRTLAIGYRSLGLVEKFLKNYDESIAYFLKSKKISEENHYQDLQMSLYMNLSECYELKKDLTNSLQYFKDGFDLSQIIQEESKNRIIEELQIKFDLKNKENETLLAKAESEVFKLKNIELADLVAKLEELNRKLIQSQEEIVRLEKRNSVLAMIATTNHELNQPLSILKGSLELFLSYTNSLNFDIKVSNLILMMEESLHRIEKTLKKYNDNTNNFYFDTYLEDTDMVVFEDRSKVSKKSRFRK